MSAFDVVLVGSGVSSLTAAVLLSQRGLSVCVIERYKKPGGYLHSFKRFHHQFETGAHYLGALSPGQPFHALLNYLGVYDSGDYVALDPDGFDVFQYPEFTYAFPTGYEALERSLGDQFPQEKDAISRYLNLVRESVRHYQTYHFSPTVNLDALLQSLECSLADVVNAHFSNPQLRTLFFAHCYLHGVKPQEMSFGLHALIFDSVIIGSYGLARGGDHLAKRFVARIEAAGGQVKLGAGVKSIEVNGSKATGVTLHSGEKIEAKWVIAGIHPKAVLKLVPPGSFPTHFYKRMERLQESKAIFGVYAEVESDTSFEPLKNYYFFNHSDPARILELNQLSERPAVAFVARPDRIPAEHLPTRPLSFHAPGLFDWFSHWGESAYGKRSPEYAQRKTEIYGRVMQQMDEWRPGTSVRVKRYETSSPLTNLHFNGSEEGSAYGIYHSMGVTGIRAIGPRTRIPNLVLTGQNTLVPGIMGAAISGLRAAGTIVGLEPMLEDLASLRDV